MSKILTAEELIDREFKLIEKSIEDCSKGIISEKELFSIYDEHSITEKGTKALMIEFAKYHVKQALVAAANKAELNPLLQEFIEDSWTDGSTIDKNSILNVYPLENIK